MKNIIKKKITLLNKLKEKNINVLKIIIGVALILTLGIKTSPIIAHAENEPKVSFKQLVGVRVKPIIPTNQVDSTIPYFYLREKVNSSDTVQLKLINDSNEAKEFSVNLNNASTNRNGLIVYETDKYDKEYLKNPITNLAKVDETDVTIPANGSKLVNIKINTPSEEFKGISVGGIVVKEKTKKNKTEGMENIYSYTVGLVLTEEKNPHLYEHTDLKLTSVKPVLDNGYKLIEADILNPYPEIFDKMKIKGSILNEKGEVILSNELEKVGIAPQTIFPFSFDLGKDELNPGKYTFEGIAYADEKNWIFKQDFTILPEEADQINNNALNKYVLPNFIYWIIIILAIETVGCIVYNFNRKRKRGGK